ncbi:MAG TPA: GNAT family N-acetyltransferase [Bryobacteraceae bacterium]|nr:GNAT family N-acetyltransferase [Bryobacteraceae bacterium]
MGEIQIFNDEHAPGLAALFFRAMRGQTRLPGVRLPNYLREVLLLSPWTSASVPSYVYVEKSKIVGSLGVIPRPMEFRGKPITVATITQFMVDPEYRRGPAAVQLLRRLFQGPQEMSWTDGASDEVNGIWAALGGHTAPLYAFNWIRILRPFETGRSGLRRASGLAHRLGSVAGILTGPADSLLAKLPLPILRKPDSPFSSTPASPEELLDCIHEIGWREPLKPVYSEPSFSWLISQAAGVPGENLRTMIVRNPEGLRCGWFVYRIRKNGDAFVLQLGIRRRDHFAPTLRALFRDAWEQGAATVKGQSIPKYLTALTSEHGIFRHPTAATLVHSNNPDIANTVRLGDAALTRLDGECWLRFASDDWI